MEYSQKILIAIIGVILGVILVGFMITLVFLYRLKTRRYKSDLQTKFSKTLLETKVEIQEATMKQIAQELHDDLAAIASVITIHLDVIRPENIEETKTKITRIQELSQLLSTKLTTVSRNLNSDFIKQNGFPKVIRNLLNQLSETKLLEVNLQVTGKEYRLQSDHEIIVFRICQEVLNNVLKHSNASRLDVTLDYAPDSLAIEIIDDGKGFDTALYTDDPENTNGGVGWLNITSRTKMINAATTIRSEINKGTQFNITIPTKIMATV